MIEALLWGIASAIGTSIWNLFLINTPKKILGDVKLKSIYLRILLIFAGIFSLITLLIPKIGIDNKSLLKIRKNVSLVYILLAAFSLLFYQLLLIYAFSAGGAVAVALVNLNILIMVAYNAYFHGDKTDLTEWILLLLLVVLTIGINYYKHTYLK